MGILSVTFVVVSQNNRLAGLWRHCGPARWSLHAAKVSLLVMGWSSGQSEWLLECPWTEVALSNIWTHLCWEFSAEIFRCCWQRQRDESQTLQSQQPDVNELKLTIEKKRIGLISVYSHNSDRIFLIAASEIFELLTYFHESPSGLMLDTIIRRNCLCCSGICIKYVPSRSFLFFLIKNK